ncbi:MAG: PQQ-dependent sugar dehydrogenase [Deltaproteobacteria bacterium]|nr:PQQ-dependent sugar dehydrogenase [Deltaproteobacteria bacterium]
MRTLRLALLVVLVLAGLVLLFLQPIRRAAVAYLSLDYVVDEAPTQGATFDALDEGRTRFEVAMREVASGLDQPTELVAVPGSNLLLVAERGGTLRWLDIEGGARGVLLEVDTRTVSEQGLLGVALHPEFPKNGRLFVNYVQERAGDDHTVIEEWRVPAGSDLATAKATAHAELLTVEQPYQNHNGGQLLFGPDGKLYVPLGDGGLKNDVHGNAQDRSTLLGSILRLDVDLPAPHVPPDNPFVGEEDVRPEIWAYGVRNPWRSAFDTQGRLIVADVGQDLWEEVGFARRGESLGWNAWEGLNCFPPDAECNPGGHIAPFWEYPHPQGLSITGGLVYAGAAIPELRGRFLTADFVTGRLWGVPVPPSGDGPVTDADVFAMGRWDFLPSAFAATRDGEVLIADFGRGRVMKLEPK